MPAELRKNKEAGANSSGGHTHATAADELTPVYTFILKSMYAHVMLLVKGKAAGGRCRSWITNFETLFESL